MENEIKEEDLKRLAEIGAVFDSIGVSTVELAERFKEHIIVCPRGKKYVGILFDAD